MFSINHRDNQKLQRRAVSAQRRDQSKVCGALMLREPYQLHLRFLTNRSDGPASWRILLTDMRFARAEAKAAGQRVVGTFHSDPVGEAVPGESDLEKAAVNSLMLIYDVCGNESRLWRVIKRGVQTYAKEVAFRVSGDT